MSQLEKNVNYGYTQLRRIPSNMSAWGMRIDHPYTREDVGSYVLVGVEPASIELHHEVVVLDESGNPLNDPYIVFGFPGGNGRDYSYLMPDENYWYGAPSVLNGNVVKAGASGQSGYARHTFKDGGEDIWIWDVQDGILELPSPIVRNCTWIQTSQFIHHGVKLTFQRRKAGMLPKGAIDEQQSDAITSLTQIVNEQGTRLDALEEKLRLVMQQADNYRKLMTGNE